MTTFHHTDLAAPLDEPAPPSDATPWLDPQTLERATHRACVAAWLLLAFGCLNVAIGPLQILTIDWPVAPAFSLYCIYVTPFVPHTLTLGAVLAALALFAQHRLWWAPALTGFLLETALAILFWLTR